MIRLCKIAAALGLLIQLIWWGWPAGELRHPPGVRSEAAPRQSDLPAHSLGKVHGYDITAVATYELSARVLRTKHYWADANDLVPYDVALGWGPMSDQSVLDRLEITQGNRFYFYGWREQPPIPLDEMISHSSNHHVIPANRQVAAAVRQLRRGEFVKMRGSLVNVSGPDGFHWNTSLSRTDSGRGACEVFYVESIAVSNDPA